MLLHKYAKLQVRLIVCIAPSGALDCSFISNYFFAYFLNNCAGRRTASLPVQSTIGGAIMLNVTFATEPRSAFSCYLNNFPIKPTPNRGRVVERARGFIVRACVCMCFLAPTGTGSLAPYLPWATASVERGPFLCIRCTVANINRRIKSISASAGPTKLL